MDVKQYIDQLAQTAGLSEEEKANILKVAANEKFAKGLEENMLLRSDYSRKMDELKADKDKKDQEVLQYYQKEVLRKASDQKLLDQWAAQVQAYEAQYGKLENGNGNNVNHSVQGDLLTKDAVEKMLSDKLQQQQQSMLTVVKWVGQKPVEHYKTFGEPLDLAAIEKIAVDKGYSLDQAYQEYSAPLLHARQQADMEKKIADAKAEGAREFASTHKLPIDSKPREYHALFDQKPRDQVPDPKTPQGERQLANNFADAWNSANATSGG